MTIYFQTAFFVGRMVAYGRYLVQVEHCLTFTGDIGAIPMISIWPKLTGCNLTIQIQSLQVLRPDFLFSGRFSFMEERTFV